MDIQETLKALYNELEEKAIEPQYYRYYIKDANQIIRKHFESYASQQMPSEEYNRELLEKFLMDIDECYACHIPENAKQVVDEYLKSLHQESQTEE